MEVRGSVMELLECEAVCGGVWGVRGSVKECFTQLLTQGPVAAALAV